MKGKLFTFCFHFSLHYFASMEIKIVMSTLIILDAHYDCMMELLHHSQWRSH